VNRRQVVLDASALVALIRKERGWQTISTILDSGTAVTTPAGLAGTLDICRRRGVGRTRNELCEFLALLGLGIDPSIGDAACLSVGRRLNAIVVFSDNAWNSLVLSGIEILPYR
jgi:PIN domain nuclease of toxin-antitoxin system